jgi:hypothetical protein
MFIVDLLTNPLGKISMMNSDSTNVLLKIYSKMLLKNFLHASSIKLVIPHLHVNMVNAAPKV